MKPRSIDWPEVAHRGACIVVALLHWLTLHGGNLLLTCVAGLDGLKQRLKARPRAAR
jgi:hypothetical protein